MTQAEKQRIAGRVEAVNASGLKVNGVWYNYSQYHGELVHPAKGAHVALEIEHGKWITALRVTGEGEAARENGQGPSPSGTAGRRPRQGMEPGAVGAGAGARNALRVAALRAAAEVHAGTGHGPEAVVQTAEALLRWLTGSAPAAESVI